MSPYIHQAFLGDHRCSGLWSREESSLHITILELRAVLRALEALEALVLDKSVRLLCDNTVAVAYIRNEGGTRSLSLFRETRDILQWCFSISCHSAPILSTGTSQFPCRPFIQVLTSTGDGMDASRSGLPSNSTSLPQSGCGSVFHQSEQPAASVCQPMPRPSNLESGCFHHRIEGHVPIYFPPVQTDSQGTEEITVISSTTDSSDPGMAQSFLVSRSSGSSVRSSDRSSRGAQTSAQPLGQTYHQNTQLLHLHVWPLSGLESDRQVFQHHLHDTQRLHRDHRLSGCTSPTGRYSRIGVRNGISIQSRPLFN